MLERKCLIIYFKNPKALKDLKRFGNITYYHKKRRYVIIYVNQSEVTKITEQLKQLKSVRYVEESHLDQDAYKIDFDVK